MLDRQHDPTPDRRGVNDLLAFLHRFHNMLCGCRGFNGKRSWTERGFEHFSFHEAGFHRQHVHAVTGEPVSQRLEVRRQPGFGGVVAGISNTPAIASDRGNANDLSRLCRLEHFGNRREPCHRADQIDFDHLAVILEAVFVHSAGREVHAGNIDNRIQATEVGNDPEEQVWNFIVLRHVVRV